MHEPYHGLRKIFEAAEVVHCEHAIGVLVQHLGASGQGRIATVTQQGVEPQQLAAMAFEP